MARGDLNDVLAFLAVAREGNFTKAAAKLGVSQSALSQTVRNLESRLGLRLLTRTTRSVSSTEAGERLLQAVGPHLEEAEAEIAALTALRAKPAGTVRIVASDQAAEMLLLPTFEKLYAEYPDIKFEIMVDNGLTDIVRERLDAGVRLGEQLARDMIAVRISPDIRMAAVASPSYLRDHPEPKTPRDLTAHRCINLRLQSAGGLYVWEFEKNGRALNVRVDGQMIFNTGALCAQAAIAGAGIAYVTEDRARPFIENGRLVRVLEDWCPPFTGYHLYYPSRRQLSPALSIVIEALRYRG